MDEIKQEGDPSTPKRKLFTSPTMETGLSPKLERFYLSQGSSPTLRKPVWGTETGRSRLPTIVSSSPSGEMAKVILRKKIWGRRHSLSLKDRGDSSQRKKHVVGLDSSQPSIVSFCKIRNMDSRSSDVETSRSGVALGEQTDQWQA